MLRHLLDNNIVIYVLKKNELSLEPLPAAIERLRAALAPVVVRH